MNLGVGFLVSIIPHREKSEQYDESEQYDDEDEAHQHNPTKRNDELFYVHSMIAINVAATSPKNVSSATCDK